jgi:Tfp pilus assembly protein PilF
MPGRDPPATARAWGAAAFERALHLLGEERDLDTTERSLLGAEWTAARAHSRLETGRTLPGDEAALREALAALAGAASAGDTATDPSHTRRQATAADLRLQLSRIQLRGGHTAQARTELEAALQDAPSGSLLHAKAEFQLGGLFALSGQPHEALPLWQRAAEQLAVGELRAQVRLRAQLAMNTGAALADLGRSTEALDRLREAVTLFEGAASASPAGGQAELARALRNLGFALSRGGRHTEAAHTLQQAAAASGRALAHARSDDNRKAWQWTRAGVLNNLGYTLFALGRIDESRRALRRALRALADEQAPVPVQQGEWARALVNLAHVQAHRLRLAQAHRLYTQAASHLAGQLAQGKPVAAVDRINAELGRARMALRLARADEAAASFGTAMAELAALTHQGQLQHELTWLAAWQAQRDAWLAAPRAVSRRARGADAGAAGTVDAADAAGAADAANLGADLGAAALITALQAPPRHAVGLGPEPLLAVARACNGNVALALPSPPGRASTRLHTERVDAAFLRYLMAWLSDLLGEQDPHWIRAHRGAVDGAIEALGAAAAQRAEASALLAQWFLATRGLRAQHMALADGDEPEFVEFRSLLRELHGVEQQILGEPEPEHSQRADPAAAGPGQHIVEATLSLTGAPGSRSQGAAWLALSTRVRAARHGLAARGLLPLAPTLDAEQVLARLVPGQALLLLTRLQPDRLLLVVLARPPKQALHEVPRVEHRLATLDAQLAALSCAQLHALARAAWCDGARGAFGEGDLFALAMFERLWYDAVAPTFEALAVQGLSAIDLVPSGELHLVPWGHFAETTSGASPGNGHGRPRVRIYPSSGSWWRCSAEPPLPRRPRWALAAGGTPTPLPALRWAELERRLSLRLWGPRMQAGAADDNPAADALLGLGHGMTPESNPAQVGLLTGSRVLLPRHLLRVRGCRFALLSACLLAHTDESSGEPLGFMAGAFEHGIACATGWLTEVPDRSACLYSLAMQWALAQALEPADVRGRREPRHDPAHQREPGGADWGAILARTRADLRQGAWPLGFGPWLASAIADDDARREVGDAPAHPPAELLRVLPWSVTLG